MEGTKKPLSHQGRSGSEARQKQRRITFRLNDQEKATVEQDAVDAGVTTGTYIRDRLLKAPQTRRRRRPSVEVQTLAALLGQLRKAGSNIHQILKRVNFGDTPAGTEIRGTAKDCDEAAAAILEVLGRVRR
jgi:hypothetical protein